MELVLAAIGVVVAFAMILAASKRSRRTPPANDGAGTTKAGDSRRGNDGGDGGEGGNGRGGGD